MKRLDIDFRFSRFTKNGSEIDYVFVGWISKVDDSAGFRRKIVRELHGITTGKRTYIRSTFEEYLRVTWNL